MYICPGYCDAPALKSALASEQTTLENLENVLFIVTAMHRFYAGTPEMENAASAARSSDVGFPANHQTDARPLGALLVTAQNLYALFRSFMPPRVVVQIAQLAKVTALLRKSDGSRISPFPGHTYPMAIVIGMPRAVKRFSTAART